MILVAWGSSLSKVLCLLRRGRRVLYGEFPHRLIRATALLVQWRRLDTTLITRARITPPNK
jgi:hypothetical protein